MVQGYYTLEEAAQNLGLTTDRLSQMAQRREIRAFADRGTWRFRTQDVEEMGRRMGQGSNDELALGEPTMSLPSSGAPSSSSGAPSSSSRMPPPSMVGGGADDDLFEFELSAGDSDIGMGFDAGFGPKTGGASSAKLGSGGFGAGPAGSGGNPAMAGAGGSGYNVSPGSGIGHGPPSLIPKSTNIDSDVHLVLGGDDDGEFSLTTDTGINLDDGNKSKLAGRRSTGAAPDSSAMSARKTKLPAAGRGETALRAEDDDLSSSFADIDASSAPDSDVQLNDESEILSLDETSGMPSHIGGDDDSQQELLLDDLDAELKRAEEEARDQKPTTRARPKTDSPDMDLPESSIFELSESDLDFPESGATVQTNPPPRTGGLSGPSSGRVSGLGPGSSSGGSRSGVGSSSSRSGVGKSGPASSRSGLGLGSSANLGRSGIGSGSSRNLADDDDEEVSLGDLSPSDLTGASGASGINLHSPADTGINLERMGPSSGDEIEFELSLDADSTPPPTSNKESESSEFELTLDDSGGLAPLTDDDGGLDGADAGEKDIFETDFDIPALEESGSEAVALDDADTDLESDDFDFAGGEGESGSAVVALDTDDADQLKGTVARKRPKASAASDTDDDEESGEMGGSAVLDEDDLDMAVTDDDEAADEDVAAVGPRVAVATAPASWGLMPAIVMAPCVLVMFFLALTAFELLHGMLGHKQPLGSTGILIKPLAGLLFDDLPKD